MLLGKLSASLLGNLFTGKVIYRAGKGLMVFFLEIIYQK